MQPKYIYSLLFAYLYIISKIWFGSKQVTLPVHLTSIRINTMIQFFYSKITMFFIIAYMIIFLLPLSSESIEQYIDAWWKFIDKKIIVIICSNSTSTAPNLYYSKILSCHNMYYHLLLQTILVYFAYNNRIILQRCYICNTLLTVSFFLFVFF